MSGIACASNNNCFSFFLMFFYSFYEVMVFEKREPPFRCHVSALKIYSLFFGSCVLAIVFVSHRFAGFITVWTSENQLTRTSVCYEYFINSTFLLLRNFIICAGSPTEFLNFTID